VTVLIDPDLEEVCSVRPPKQPIGVEPNERIGNGESAPGACYAGGEVHDAVTVLERETHDHVHLVVGGRNDEARSRAVPPATEAARPANSPDPPTAASAPWARSAATTWETTSSGGMRGGAASPMDAVCGVLIRKLTSGGCRDRD